MRTAKRAFFTAFQSTQPKRAATKILSENNQVKIFQSTQPKRAATNGMRYVIVSVRISIHAAQEGCDIRARTANRELLNISIHAAQEGCDRKKQHNQPVPLYFNPRSPRGLRQMCIYSAVVTRGDFNPRSPRGLRLSASAYRNGSHKFQSTQPKRAATNQESVLILSIFISIHAAQEGCDWLNKARR